MKPPNPKDATKLAGRIAPLLAGQPVAVQGAALADLLAIWLAGHVVHGDPAASYELRETLLAEHIEFVRTLIPINERIIHGSNGKQKDAT